MPYLPTDIVAGQAGHVDHSNEAYELINQHQNGTHSSRINVQRPPSEVSSVGATGDGVTDDNIALQNIFDYMQGGNTAKYEVWFPAGPYLTSKPLRIWTGTHIKGPCTIRPHPSFDWVNHPYWEHPLYRPTGNPQPGDIGLLELWNGGTSRGGASRMYLDDVYLVGGFQPGSLGILSKFQQPTWSWKVRIDEFDTGWAMWGQQSVHHDLEIIDCKVGLYLGPDIGGLGTFGAPGSTAKFHNFHTLNIERYSDCAIRMDCDGPNWIQMLHVEAKTGEGVHAIDCRGGAFTLQNGWGTHGGNNNHVFVIGDKTPPPLRMPYTISNFRLGSTNTGGQLMIDDKVRGFQRLVDLQPNIDHIQMLYQNSTEHNYDANVEYLGDEGGTVRIGGIKGGTAAPPGHSGAQFTVRSNVNQGGPSVRFHDSTNTLRAGATSSGNLFAGAYNNSTRANALLPLSTVGTMIWNTDDNAPNFWDGTAWRDAVGVVT